MNLQHRITEQDGYVDSIELDGFAVVPSQSQATFAQPLFYHNPTGRWCTLAGATGTGLNIRYLDGSYAWGVNHLDVSNLGIQA